MDLLSVYLLFDAVNNKANKQQIEKRIKELIKKIKTERSLGLISDSEAHDKIKKLHAIVKKYNL